MTRHPKRKSRAKLLRSLYIWHRYIGLAAAAFVIMLSVTGLALNHTEQLELDSTHVTSNLLLEWYGVHAPQDMTSYRAGPHTVTAAGSQVYWNTTRLSGIRAPLVGAIAYTDLIILAVPGKLLLFTPGGELVEQLDGAAGVPAGMQALGITPDNELAIHAAHGYYRTNADFLEWQETDTLDADWASAVQPAQELTLAVQAAYRGTGLSLERVMLDIHSGRILGSPGVYLVDAAAVLFLLLALSGVWLWARRRNSARTHQRAIEEHNRAASPREL
jgi:uncharacterized iron-regulated membrane protein